MWGNTNNCKFNESVCHNCNKKRHLAKTCRGPRSKPEGGQTGQDKFTAMKPESAARHLDSTLQDCFDHVDWDMLRIASDNNIDVYGDSVSEFINKCIARQAET